jgi:hypothetical protein
MLLELLRKRLLSRGLRLNAGRGRAIPLPEVTAQVHNQHARYIAAENVTRAGVDVTFGKIVWRLMLA